MVVCGQEATYTVSNQERERPVGRLSGAILGVSTSLSPLTLSLSYNTEKSLWRRGGGARERRGGGPEPLLQAESGRSL